MKKTTIDIATIKKAQIKELFEKYSGEIPIAIYLRFNGTGKKFFINNKVKITDELVNGIHKLLGEESITYQTM